MKKILYFLTALAMIAISSCKPEEKPSNEEPMDYKAHLTGEWHCAPAQYDADIYIAFNQDGSFDLYQKIGDGRHRHYSGRWNSEDSILSGTYSDGSPWGSTYQLVFNDANTLVLTATDSSEEAMTYARKEIPAQVKENSINVKSADEPDYSPAF